MNKTIKHIILLFWVLLSIQNVFGQKVRYVEQNSIHALSVPENPDYSFEWTIYYGDTGVLQEPSKTNVTQNIKWSYLTTYSITVRPILDSVGCYGEPVNLDVIVVEHLSLHTFDDVYFTDVNTPVSANVSENDFDETGSNINYNPTPVIQPQHGSVELSIDGTFTYTPDAGFVGEDYFVYEAFNDYEIPMFTNSMVTIVVQPPSPQAELSVTKSGPTKALFGEKITYVLIVKNNGPDTAPNVVLRDTLAFGLSGAEYSTGGQPTPWNNEINIGSLASGDSMVVYLFANVNEFAPEFIYNQALTYSDIYDPFYPNNNSIFETQVSNIYVELPNQLFVPSCDTRELPVKSDANNEIAKIQWLPGHGLSDSTIINPVFVPDEATIGKVNMYIVKVTDVKGFVAVDTTYIVVPPVPEAIITGDTLFRDLEENIFIYGDQSIGDGLDYFWWTNDGLINSLLIYDSIEVSSIGTYHLDISDQLGCESTDSVVVLLRSHPPIAINDSVAIQAASDSTINVLANDSDINNFDLHVSGILTEPKHSTYTYDADGNFTIRPDTLFWEFDSIQYEVCNNGYPVQCSSAWIIIDALRPPLNADVKIQKTGDEIAFWGDTIRYDLTVWSNGPDTATVTNIVDNMADGLVAPMYSLDEGKTWADWNGRYTYKDSLYPGETIIRIKIKAFVHESAEREINNIAWINTEILENDLSSDTSKWTTKIKEPIIANAGEDVVIGSCSEPIELDATASIGENLTYKWTPSRYLDDATSPTPTFTAGETTTYILTITDDDDISDRDTVVVTVLPPPLADAGPDKYLKEGKTVLLDGSGSTPTSLSNFYWEAITGRIVEGTETRKRASADTLGTYILTVTDGAGCTDSDEVEVFPFFYPPFAIPDYYSTDLATPFSDNVLDNDFEPNGIFTLSVTPGTFSTSKGGTVTIGADGSFDYNPPKGTIDIDVFNYTVCNDAVPPRCSEGYVQVTINQPKKTANLAIQKIAVQPEALTNDKYGVQWLLTIENKGSETAEGVVITDYLSDFLLDAQYSLNGAGWKAWTGTLAYGNMSAGQEIQVGIRCTASNDSPEIIYNAASVASKTYDPRWEWEDVANRNVDTASVKVASDLFAIAELVELNPEDTKHSDLTIGYCDDVSYLSAERSKSNFPDLLYEWSPREFLTNPDESITYFNHELLNDTTITFTLTVYAGEQSSSANVTVNFSPEPFAAVGSGRKMNEGEDYILDATASKGAGARFTWWNKTINKEHTRFANNNVLTPIISTPGVYELTVEDMHGCSDIRSVTVVENEVYAVNDFIVLLANDTIQANLLTNDYDPNDGDSLFFTGTVFSGPFHGKLLDNPDSYTNLKSASAINAKISADGTFVYVPNRGYVGDDYFTYEVCDNNEPQLCVQGRVFIKVLAVDNVNTPPTANHDYLFVNINDTLTTNVTSNDFDLDGGQITLGSIINDPVKGKVEISRNGLIKYTPNSGQTGIDEFVYEICDNGIPSKCDTARVVVNIHKLRSNQTRPVAVDDAYFVVEKTITGNVMDNDFDPNGGTISVNETPIEGPYHGIFELSRDGYFSYTPDPTFEGTDQIVYQLKKQGSLFVAYATIYIVSLDEGRYTTDVAIEKTAPEVILSGSTIEYQLIVNVKGPSLANDVLVSDTIYNRLTNYRYSTDGGSTWNSWGVSNKVDQMMLYAVDTILVRADIPDVWTYGKLSNTARVDHDMNEKLPSNNNSKVVTDVYQRVIARPGVDVTIGACVDEYKLDATSSLGMSTLKFEWLKPTSTLLDDPESATPTFTTEPGQSTEFTLVVSSELNGIFDQDTATVTITVGQEPISVAGDDWWAGQGNKDPYTLDGSASTGDGPLEYLWWTTDNDKNVIVIANADTVTIQRSGDYNLTITDIYGCQDNDMMHVGYSIDQFYAIDDTIYTYQQTPVNIYVLRNDIIDKDNDEYYLDLLLEVESPLHGTTVTFASDSMFVYTPEDYFSGDDEFVYSITTLSYTDEAKVHIKVLKLEPLMPQGFSPNGDGINDVLIIPNIELYRDNHVVIFNRWGNIVYEKTNYDNNDPWNGVANKGIRVGSGAVPTGVYYYMIDLGDDDRIQVDIPLSGGLYIATDNSR